MGRYVDYRKVFNYLDINRGDILYLSSDITRLALHAAADGERFDIDAFIDGILDKLGDEGTLMIAAFNWDFCKGKTFDYLNSSCQTGALGTAALKRKDFRRTKHPIYSFAVCGKDAEALYSLENKDSFGPDSPFAYMYRNKAKSLSIDVFYNYCYTFCLYPAQEAKVSYRFVKNFNAGYIDEKRREENRTYSMFVKYLELDVKFDSTALYNDMKNTGIAKETRIDGTVYSLIDIFGSYSMIYDDCVNNRSRKQCSYIGQEDEALLQSIVAVSKM